MQLVDAMQPGGAKVNTSFFLINGPPISILWSLWGLGVVLYVQCGVIWGGAREGMHFMQ